jgi:hypothetical protein
MKDFIREFISDHLVFLTFLLLFLTFFIIGIISLGIFGGVCHFTLGVVFLAISGFFFLCLITIGLNENN